MPTVITGTDGVSQVQAGAVESGDLETNLNLAGKNLTLPAGTTAQRPASPNSGNIRVNTDTDKLEYYDGSDWQELGLTRYRYLRYKVDSASVQHHPRVSRLIIEDAFGVQYDIEVFTSDNCADSGTIPSVGTAYTLDLGAGNEVILDGGKAGGYGTFSGGTRGANVEVLGSNDNINYTSIGIADFTTSACGVILANVL